jgi:alpha-tubulin suppressor-like RCC1 family protein
MVKLRKMAMGTYIIAIFLLMFTLAACTGNREATEAPTPVPSTPAPAQTTEPTSPPTQTPSPTPEPTPEPPPQTDIKDLILTGQTIMSASHASYIIDSNGGLWAWGSNERGQIGDGTQTILEFINEAPYVIRLDDNDRFSPVKIMDDVVAVSVGNFHTMAIKTDGSLWGWGLNSSGQVGNGEYDRYTAETPRTQLTPVKVLEDVVAVSAGGQHTAAIKSDGSLWFWGSGSRAIFIQSPHMSTRPTAIIGDVLPDGVIEYYETVSIPTPVKAMDDVIAVSAGNNHIMAIKSDGSLWAWGNNRNGRLGAGEAIEYITPIWVMDDVAYVSAGFNYTMVIKTDGSLWSWGSNGWGGFLGDGTTGERRIPAKIMDDVAAISAGNNHVMAIKKDGTLWGWGDNSNGQLGNGEVSGANPTPIFIMDDVIAVATGGSHTMAIKADNSVWVWGFNLSGQLGDGTADDRLLPVKIMDNAFNP